MLKQREAPYFLVEVYCKTLCCSIGTYSPAGKNYSEFRNGGGKSGFLTQLSKQVF